MQTGTPKKFAKLRITERSRNFADFRFADFKKSFPAHLCLKVKMSIYFNHHYFSDWISSLSKNCKSADRKLCDNGMEDSATVSRLTEFIYCWRPATEPAGKIFHYTCLAWRPTKRHIEENSESNPDNIFPPFVPVHVSISRLVCHWSQ